jgi:hypothetical protein
LGGILTTFSQQKTIKKKTYGKINGICYLHIFLDIYIYCIHIFAVCSTGGSPWCIPHKGDHLEVPNDGGLKWEKSLLLYSPVKEWETWGKWGKWETWETWETWWENGKMGENGGKKTNFNICTHMWKIHENPQKL